MCKIYRVFIGIRCACSARQKIPRGTKITDDGCAAIRAYLAVGKSCRCIAQQGNRSKTAIADVRWSPAGESKDPRLGAKPKLTRWEARRVIRLAIEQQLSAMKIKYELGVQCHSQTILNTINGSKYARCRKQKQDPDLKPRHKKARLKFVKERVANNEFWRYVLFSDEVGFYLRWARRLQVLLARPPK
ncbi:TPA: hypothetical protein N0F65_002986 [Lagenidium giganteum]|uniref:Transposase Tc1-like domain-containing protein n=1 Tax=Lagenidium giganteum TaxID=4803 RepID=A0AAV2YHS8_9STRA|nr:TPA: hypothetical protein N0F65_002986 [Lagenidium giganteum]